MAFFLRRTDSQKSEWAAIVAADIADFAAAVAAVGGGGGGAVSSVNGETGAVVLTAADVGAVDSSTWVEQLQDAVAAMILNGTNITTSYNDAAGTLTINASGSTDPEVVRDTIGTALVAGTGISISVNDAGDTITLSATGGGGGATSGLPSWGSSAGTFDPLRSIYRGSTDCLGAWRAAMGRAKAWGEGVSIASPYAHILVIGDSHADGKMDDTLSGAADWQINAWAEVLKARLVAAGIPDGGTGWVKFGGLQNPPDPRWSTSGATAFTGRTGQSLFSWGNNTAAGMVATLTPLSPISDGVAVDILLKNTGKPWTLAAQKSDGTALTSITTTRDGTNTLTVQSITGQTQIGKLVATTLTGTGGNWNLGGGQIRRAGGLLVSNWGISSSYASHNNTTYWGWDEDPTDAVFFAYEGSQALSIGAVPPVDLVLIQLGGNDDLLGATDATITAALTTIFARYPNASKMLVLNWGPDDTNRHNMFAAYYALADTLGIALYDTLHRTGGSTLMNSRGLYNAGTSLIHPNQAGHAALGYGLADALLT